MNFKVNETIQKLNGSYYTPDWLARFVVRWIVEYRPGKVLEPSCGDGVFFDAFNGEIKSPISIDAFDTDDSAVEKCKAKNLSANMSLSVKHADFLGWANANIKSNNRQSYDAVVGNPPFIRYQYMEKTEQQAAQELFAQMGMKFTKHTNIWLPFVLASVEFLKPGGHLGMIIPSEILHVLYAQGLRDYLIKKCSRILLIDPEDLWFENTLQGAMLILADKKVEESECQLGIVRTIGRQFATEDPTKLFLQADYISPDYLTKKWTYALLTKEERAAFYRVKNSKYVFQFKKLAEVDVGIVTGANKYFLVNNDVVKEYGLEDVAYPMFGRSEHCRGIIYDEEQHRQNEINGYPTNFIYFADEEKGKRHSDYIHYGEEQGIHLRYKCRIRKPWYKVPSVFTSEVNMLKRSNGMPRLILNRLAAYNTDTAYRITPKNNIQPEALVYCFINSLTALSAELEGRFYGGGVLELVPSEIEQLMTVYVEDEDRNIEMLNERVKNLDKEALLRQQDAVVFSKIDDVNTKDIEIIHNAFIRLQLRRQRTGHDNADDA